LKSKFHFVSLLPGSGAIALRGIEAVCVSSRTPKRSVILLAALNKITGGGKGDATGRAKDSAHQDVHVVFLFASILR